MPDSLPALEERRSQIVLTIARLGDFRRGSIHASFRRCGKPILRLRPRRPSRPRPQVRLAYKIRGKSVQQALCDPAQRRKAKREVAAFRRFQQLSAELVDVNERICQLRPTEAQDLAEAPQATNKKRSA